jgi:hypothetical protein
MKFTFASKQMVPQSVLVVGAFSTFISRQLYDNTVSRVMAMFQRITLDEDVLSMQHCSIISLGDVQLFDIHSNAIMTTSVDSYVSKDNDVKMSFRYVFAPQSVLVICIFSSFIQMQS